MNDIEIQFKEDDNILIYLVLLQSKEFHAKTWKITKNEKSLKIQFLIFILIF